MPLHDWQCEACSHWERDRFWATWREVPKSIDCPSCSEPMTRMAGRVVAWGPAAVWDDATEDFVAGSGRAEVPGEVMFAGTPLEEAAKAGETVNPYLDEGHPGYFKNDTGWKEHFDLGS